MTGELIHKKENIYHQDVQRSIKLLNDFETTSSIADEILIVQFEILIELVVQMILQ